MKSAHRRSHCAGRWRAIDDLLNDGIGEDDVEAYRRDGAVVLRGMFGRAWLDLVAAGVEKNIADPGPYADFCTPEGNPGSFFGDYCNWRRFPEYRSFVFESPAAAIAARMMGSEKVNFFHEHVLVKEPGTRERTPWHHDQPYWTVDGHQVCSIWLTLDPVPGDCAIEFVAGSHRWGRWFTPRHFVDSSAYAYDGDPFEPVPDIDARRDDYDILSWEMAPGDCIVFHALTLHGAPGNPSPERRRRAFATRWTGDDATFALRPGEMSPPVFEGSPAPGEAMDCALFPAVWPRPAGGAPGDPGDGR